MKKVAWMLLSGWKTQMMAEVGARGNLSDKDKASLKEYEAGLSEGFNQAISMLKLHGYIEVDYKNELA